MSGRYFIDHGAWHDRETGRHLEDIVSEVRPSERLKALLEAVAEHWQTPEEAQAELEADGVDVNAFLARVWDDERAWLIARAERAERGLGEAIEAERKACADIAAKESRRQVAKDREFIEKCDASRDYGHAGLMLAVVRDAILARK